MSKVWVLEYSQYNAEGVLTFRDTKAVCEFQQKCQRLMKEEYEAKRSNRVNPELRAATPNSIVMKSVGMSEVWQVVAFYVDSEHN